MDVKVIATTHIGHEAEKVKYDDFSGKMVGLTNTSDNLKTLMYEDSEKALRRSSMAKEERNIEYFKHESFTLYFEGLPKIISILIDGEKSWTKLDFLIIWLKHLKARKSFFENICGSAAPSVRAIAVYIFPSLAKPLIAFFNKAFIFTDNFKSVLAEHILIAKSVEKKAVKIGLHLLLA